MIEACDEPFQDWEFSVRVSFLEIYNEELIDLLGAESVENPRLKIYEDSAKKVSLPSLKPVILTDSFTKPLAHGFMAFDRYYSNDQGKCQKP